MIITNEPGYYKKDCYGIRIENILLVKKHELYEKFLKFESLTLVPYCSKLIEKHMMTHVHLRVIRDYYR